MSLTNNVTREYFYEHVKDERELDVIPHQVERIDEWAHAMRRRFGSPIAVAVEL